jgi:hypothetical protein
MIIIIEMNNNSITGKSEREVKKVTSVLDIKMPSGNMPFVLRLIIVLTLIGGLSTIGSLLVGIGQPSASVESRLYLFRLIIGIFAIWTAYGLVRRKKWTLWAYCAIAFFGFILNPITALVPGAVVVYLLSIRKQLTS